MYQTFLDEMHTSETISTEKLWAALDDADEANAPNRFSTATCTDGVHVETLVEPPGVLQSTSDTWLDRLETQPRADALRDEPRPGRVPELSEEQRIEAEPWLENSPQDVGPDTETWTVEHLRERI